MVESPDGEVQPFTNQKPVKGAWKGKLTRIEDVRATVTCTGKPGEEADGEPVTYEASNLTDGVADTTWRCGGKALGERITLKLGEKVPVGQVGLVPGYAKTDETTQRRPLRAEQPRPAGALDHRRHGGGAADERLAH